MRRRTGFFVMMDMLTLLGVSAVCFLIMIDFGQKTGYMERITHTFMAERNLLAKIIQQANMKGYCDHPDVVETRVYNLDDTHIVRIYTYSSSRISFTMEFGIITSEEPKL